MEKKGNCLLNKFLNKIKEIDSVYIILFLIMLSIFGIFAVNRYIQDTFSFEISKMSDLAKWPYLKDGRWFMSLFLYTLDFIHASYRMEKILSWGIALISLTLSAILMYKILCDVSDNKVLNVLLSCCLTANPFVLEYFMFPEYTGIMCLGVLFVFSSIYLLYKYFNSKKKRYLLFAMLFSVFSCMCYQGPSSLLIIIPFVFVLKFANNIKEFFINTLCVGLVYSCGVLSNFMIVKLTDSSRFGNDFNLMVNIKNILIGVKNLFITNCGILPSYFLLSLFLIALFIAICNMVKTNYKKPKRFLAVIFIYLVSILSLLIVPAIPQLFISIVWMVPRSNFGYGIMGVLPILLYVFSTKKHINYTSIIYIGLMIVLLIFQFRSSMQLAKGQIEIYAYTKNETKEILSLINNYEYETGKQITKISTYNDLVVKSFYDDTRHGMDMNLRVYSVSWAYSQIVSFLSGKNYEVGLVNEEMTNYCSSNNWDDFSKDQIKFIDDTMHVCIY